MNGKELFEGMSFVDERFVEEAERCGLPKRSVSTWIKAASLAACLCLVMFAVWAVPSMEDREMTEGVIAQDSDPAGAGGAAQPQDRPLVEVPSVILYVTEMTSHGFTGTVETLTDTDVFEVGMELNVVTADGIRLETADGNPSMSADSKTDYSGSYVLVQFSSYDRETGTILADMIQEADAPEPDDPKG